MASWRRLAWYVLAGVLVVTVVSVGELDPASPVDEVRAGRDSEVLAVADVTVLFDAVLSAGSGVPAAGVGVSPRVAAVGAGLVSVAEECPYGKWSTGRCRACPVGQVWKTGIGCVVAGPKECSSGNSWMEKYRGCRKTNCPHNRNETTGYCLPAPQQCLTGETYMAEHGGCRPTSCQHGHDASTGWCRSTPECPTGQIYKEKHKACRPIHCDNGFRLNGTCRRCADKTYLWSGGECVPKTKAHRDDPPCENEGHLYYSSYESCLPASCPHGRDTNTGHCLCPAGQTYNDEHGGCRPVECTGNCRCPADHTYMEEYRGCRLLECPEDSVGRNIVTGRCESECPEGQTFNDEHGGCRPAKCLNGRNHNLRGGCEPPCSLGQKYSEPHKGCIPKHCEHGHDGDGSCLPCPPSL